MKNVTDLILKYKLNSSELLVYTYIFSRGSEVFEKQQALATDLKLARSTINLAIKNLEKYDLLECLRKRSNRPFVLKIKGGQYA